MKHSNINIDRPALTEAQIAEGQDFQSLLKAHVHVPKPWYKTSAFYVTSSLLVAGAIAVGAWFMLGEVPAENNAEPAVALHEKEMNSLVAPPIPDADIDYITTTVDCDEDQTIVIQSSEIHIPSGAFVDEDGNAVSGEVELAYREFNDKIDIFLGGIPMTVDSELGSVGLESAGMFELRGFQEGREVYIDGHRPLQVVYNGRAGAGFSNYFLDEENGWVELSESEIDMGDCEPIELVCEVSACRSKGGGSS